MDTEQKQFRILSLKQLRELSSEQRAEYLGQLTVHNLQEAARREGETQTPTPTQFDERTAGQRGTVAGIAAVAAAVVLVYIAYGYLKPPFGDEWALVFSVTAGLVAIGLLLVARDRYLRWELTRYCSKNGHALRPDGSGDGRPYEICTRCHAVMRDERNAQSVRPDA